MAPWLLRYPMCPKRALQFSLFSLIKLHLASLPLGSSYSRVAVSSVFWAQNIYFSAQTRGAPLNTQVRCTTGLNAPPLRISHRRVIARSSLCVRSPRVFRLRTNSPALPAKRGCRGWQSRVLSDLNSLRRV